MRTPRTVVPSRFHDLPRDVFWLPVALFSWYLVTYVFLPIPAVRPGLDESWRAFLTWAVEHHKQFGTEVIFSYGPWGFLLEPRGTVSAYPWQILGRLVVALAGASGIGLLGASWVRPATPRWIWAATIVVLAEPTTLIPVLLFLCTMFPGGIESRWKGLVVILIAIAAGLVACTKLTCFLLVAALIPLLLLRKGLAIIVSISVASFFLFWFAAGQGVSNLPAFLSQSMEISRGFTSAMVKGRPTFELLLALMVCGMPLLQLAARSMPPVNLERLGCLSWLTVCEFLIFRHGLIRTDPYHWYNAFLTVGCSIAILLVYLPDVASRVRPPYLKVAYGGIVLGVLAGTLAAAGLGVQEKAAMFLESFRLYPSYARKLSSLSARGPAVPAAAGSMDVFPDELSYAIQKGLPLRNRPVIQAYGAFTKSLCEKNAAFLEGQNAPREIYFHFLSIDDHYPTMEDSLAWRSLLTHFAPFSVEDEYLVLKHRERPAAYELRPILGRTIGTDEALEIPDAPGGLIWAELQVQRTLTGRLLDLLYRNEKMVLRVETARRSLDCTLLDENTAGGFLLSPYVNSQAAMMDIFQAESHRVSAEPVRRILIHRGKVQSLGFGGNVSVRLYALVMSDPAQDFPGGPIEDLGRTLHSERFVSSTEFSPGFALEGGEVRLVAGSPSSGWISQPAGKSLHVRYGIEAKRSTCSGDVSFRILFGGDASRETRLLWEDRRQSQAGKEWSAESTVNLPAPAGQRRLYFETESAERGCGVEGAYWSDLRMEP